MNPSVTALLVVWMGGFHAPVGAAHEISPKALVSVTDLSRFPSQAVLEDAEHCLDAYADWLKDHLTVCGWVEQDEVIRLRTEILYLNSIYSDLVSIRRTSAYLNESSEYAKEHSERFLGMLRAFRANIGPEMYDAGRLPGPPWLLRIKEFKLDKATGMWIPPPDLRRYDLDRRKK